MPRMQNHQIVSAAEGKRPLFRPPTPLPTRNEIIADFIWRANRNPQQLSTPSVEGMFRYPAQRHPCRA